MRRKKNRPSLPKRNVHLVSLVESGRRYPMRHIVLDCGPDPKELTEQYRHQLLSLAAEAERVGLGSRPPWRDIIRAIRDGLGTNP